MSAFSIIIRHTAELTGGPTVPTIADYQEAFRSSSIPADAYVKIKDDSVIVEWTTIG